MTWGKYQPHVSTRLVWDLREYQVYTRLIPVPTPGLYLPYIPGKKSAFEPNTRTRLVQKLIPVQHWPELWTRDQNVCGIFILKSSE